MDSFGFIITRHVNSEETNRYWNHSVNLLRKFYPKKKIIIIDDNSDAKFVKADLDYSNVEIIHSEFPGRGELLPYYYFIKTKFFENAIIIHDSVFFHKRINFDVLNGIKVIPLWFFASDKENIVNTLRITDSLKGSFNIKQKLTLNESILGMPKNKWYGCFGCQTYINFNFLSQLQNKYDISSMVNTIKNRSDRCCLERILGCIFFTENPQIYKNKAILGDITKYPLWRRYTYIKYKNNLKKGLIPSIVVKVWTGR